MFKSISSILIWSQNYRKLADWYIKHLELTPLFELTHPQDTGVAFKIGESRLFIGQHSLVVGKNIDPHRHMFNLEVNSVSNVYEKLTNNGVEFLATPFLAPTHFKEKYFASFFDLDGNIVQLFGDK